MSGGRNVIEFLTIEHTTGLELHPELMLVGDRLESTAAGGDQWNYSVCPLFSHQESSNDDDGDNFSKSFIVNSLASNILVTGVEFDVPFGYSSSSWVNDSGTDETGCHKDVCRFTPVRLRNNASAESLQAVNVMTQAMRSPYVYNLKSHENPPYLRFTIPGRSLYKLLI